MSNYIAELKETYSLMDAIKLLEKEKTQEAINSKIMKNIVFHCETEKEAKAFIKLAYESGYRWNFGDAFFTNWEVYERNTCYRIEEGSKHIHFGPLEYFLSIGINSIIEFSQIENIIKKDVMKDDFHKQIEYLESTLREARYFAKDVRAYLSEIAKQRPFTNSEKELWDRTHDVHIHTNDTEMMIQNSKVIISEKKDD